MVKATLTIFAYFSANILNGFFTSDKANKVKFGETTNIKKSGYLHVSWIFSQTTHRI